MEMAIGLHREVLAVEEPHTRNIEVEDDFLSTQRLDTGRAELDVEVPIDRRVRDPLAAKRRK